MKSIRKLPQRTTDNQGAPGNPRYTVPHASSAVHHHVMNYRAACASSADTRYTKSSSCAPSSRKSRCYSKRVQVLGLASWYDPRDLASMRCERRRIPRIALSGSTTQVFGPYLFPGSSRCDQPANAREMPPHCLHDHPNPVRHLGVSWDGPRVEQQRSKQTFRLRIAPRATCPSCSGKRSRNTPARPTRGESFLPRNRSIGHDLRASVL